MKKLISILLLAALMLTLAACGTTTPPVDDTATEGANTPESTTEEVATEPFSYKHVVIVGIDGMGAYHKGTDTPNIDSIFADYALTDVAQTYNPVGSGPCWTSMMTGVDPLVMRTVKNPGYEPKKLVNATYTEAAKKYAYLFRLFHDKYPDSTIASVTRWEDMQTLMWPQEDYIVYETLKPKHWTTAEELDFSLKYLDKLDTSKPSFTFFYFAEPDSTGHVSGWGSEEYNKKLTECDAALGEIFKKVEAKGMLDDTLFILATDHGGEGTAHGMVLTPPALTITLGFRGKTVSNAKDFDMIFRDIAAIVVEAMDLEPDPAWKKLEKPPVVPEELFKN